MKTSTKLQRTLGQVHVLRRLAELAPEATTTVAQISERPESIDSVLERIAVEPSLQVSEQGRLAYA